MAKALFIGQRSSLSRKKAVEHYILLRLRAEDVKRLAYLVEGLYQKSIQLPPDAPFTHADLKDTARTAFFGWLASLTDRDRRAIYAFDPLFVLFPNKSVQIINVQATLEGCHSVLQRFRNNVAFHSRADLTALIEAHKALRDEDTFLDLESARQDFLRLMAELQAEELNAVPELPKVLEDLGVSHHPAFANVLSTKKSA